MVSVARARSVTRSVSHLVVVVVITDKRERRRVGIFIASVDTQGVP